MTQPTRTTTPAATRDSPSLPAPSAPCGLSRRTLMGTLAGALASLPALPARSHPQRPSFTQWIETFRARARARGIPDATYTRVMSGVNPDTAVFDLNRVQPE